MAPSVGKADAFKVRFLSQADLERIKTWDSDALERKNRSPITWVNRFMSGNLIHLLPADMAPSILKLISLVLAIHAFYCAHKYREDQSNPLPPALGVFMAIMYMMLDALSKNQADRTKNRTPIFYVFRHAVDNIAIVFVVLTFCINLHVNDPVIQWYVVQACYLIFFWAQVSGFRSGFSSFGLFTGPGEALTLVNCFILYKTYFGMGFVHELYQTAVVKVLIPMTTKSFWYSGPMLARIYESMPSIDDLKEAGVPMERLPLDFDTFYNQPDVIFEVFMFSVYRSLLFMIFVRVACLPAKHSQTRNLLLVCLFYRAIPDLLSVVGLTWPIRLENVIVDGFFMAILTTEMVMARMADREIHPWLPVMAMMSLLDKFLSLMLFMFYFLSNIYDVCMFLNLPLFSLVRNVYIDGVFDLCHLGHKNHIFRALEYGNRLIVGVMSDEDVAKYKRPPVMTLEERCWEVEALFCVYKVRKKLI